MLLLYEDKALLLFPTPFRLRTSVDGNEGFVNECKKLLLALESVVALLRVRCGNATIHSSLLLSILRDDDLVAKKFLAAAKTIVLLLKK